MSYPQITNHPRLDTTPDMELSTLANVYRFVLDCHAKKEGTRPGAPNDGTTKIKEGDSANDSLPH